MEQKEYKRCLDEIKCSEGFRNKMEKALSAEPAGAEEYEDSVSHVERIKTSSFRRYAALAAAFVLVCGAAGTVWYGISKSSRSSDHITAANEGVTSEDTTVIQAATEDRVVLPEGISNISWMSGDTPISMSFCTSDGQYAHTLEVTGVEMAPVAELIKSSQWTDDSDFIYSDFYVAGEAIINEQGQLLTGGQVYRTDSAHEVADAVYNAFSNSEDFTVNDELFYRISRSTENFTAMNASIEVIYDSPFSENGNIQCIGSNSGEMELTIDENGMLHERTDIESAEYESDGNDAVYKETIDGQTYTETMLSRFEPGLSYTQLINKVLYKLPVNKHEEEFVENGGRYVLDYGDEIHELVLDPDTGAITEYMEYSSDRTYISYKLRDIEYTGMEKSAADQHPETKDDNAAAQNIIRLNIPDAVNEIVYYPELSGNIAGGMPTGISASADTAELKALLSGCKWEKSTEGFDGTGCYVIINYSNGCDVKLNEQGQMNWKEQTFVTNDSTDDIISLLRGIFVYEPGSVEEYKADMVMSGGSYDVFLARGSLTYQYYRHNKGIENGVEFEDRCSYEVECPECRWDVRKGGQSMFAGTGARSGEVSMSVTCRRDGVNIIVSESGKDIGLLDSAGELKELANGHFVRTREYNTTSAPGPETAIPDYGCILDRAIYIMTYCITNESCTKWEENGIRYVQASFPDGTMTDQYTTDVTMGIDENGMLVRYKELHDNETFYDMTINELILDPKGDTVHDDNFTEIQ